MGSEEARQDVAQVLSRESRVDILLQRIALHEAQGVEIAKETEALGLDAKKLKAIRAAKKTLDALISEGIVTSADALGGVA